jgi:hypothetical protein
MTARTEVTAREVTALILGAVLVSVIMNWPLVLHLGSSIPGDLGDPLPESWQVAWGGHALANQPLDFWQSNQFWPFDDTLAFSDALVGYAPAGLVGSGPHAAVARYDLLFLFAYALPFVGAYLLARELGIGIGGALVAGAAFAYAPYRLEQVGHMQVISSGGIPLALAFGVRGYRLGRLGWIVLGWVVAAWQLSIGFTLGVPLAYLLATLVLVAGVVWLRRGRPALDRRVLAATAVGAAIFAICGGLLVRPYLRVVDAHPEARRSATEVQAYSGPPWIYLVAPEQNLIWGDATGPIRDGLTNIPEKTLFPGLVILVLAIAGVRSRGYPRRLRLGLAIAVGVVSLLALGFTGGWSGYLWPYRWIYEVLPGWQAIRVPSRLVTFSTLGLALLAGIGAQAAARAATRRRGVRAGVALPAVLALAVVVEGMGLPFDPTDERTQPRVPSVPPSVASVPAPQLHLPAVRPAENRRYVLWSTDGFPSTVNGRSSFNPPFTLRLIRSEKGFPDRSSVARLERLGVRSVVLHSDLARGTPWAGAAARPVAGLPLERSRNGPLVVYELRSPNAGAARATDRPAAPARRSR